MFVLRDDTTLAEVFFEQDTFDGKAMTPSLEPFARIFSVKLAGFTTIAHGDDVHPKPITKPSFHLPTVHTSIGIHCHAVPLRQTVVYLSIVSGAVGVFDPVTITQVEIKTLCFRKKEEACSMQRPGTASFFRENFAKRGATAQTRDKIAYIFKSRSWSSRSARKSSISCTQRAVKGPDGRRASTTLDGHLQVCDPVLLSCHNRR